MFGSAKSQALLETLQPKLSDANRLSRNMPDLWEVEQLGSLQGTSHLHHPWLLWAKLHRQRFELDFQRYSQKLGSTRSRYLHQILEDLSKAKTSCQCCLCFGFAAMVCLRKAWEGHLSPSESYQNRQSSAVVGHEHARPTCALKFGFSQYVKHSSSMVR